ncbi:hypothetical protein [Streptomyces sp. HNM0574]|uniref:hypothetical protein n=1 Tax=Streptomyces sp. HNM0574 TaxID=2714954 RepID=UPI00146E5677|nr:hypothetical protein [Streptomyces sp. HNM0574]NLU70617.1 hypothetical protein [Streptomyces sp. HNM0574]
MTPYGTDRVASAGPEGDQTEYAWEDPLTRLLLLLEIAQQPSWLRDISRPTCGSARRSGA